jgi:hypothetical protein
MIICRSHSNDAGPKYRGATGEQTCSEPRRGGVSVWASQPAAPIQSTSGRRACRGKDPASRTPRTQSRFTETAAPTAKTIASAGWGAICQIYWKNQWIQQSRRPRPVVIVSAARRCVSAQTAE